MNKDQIRRYMKILRRTIDTKTVSKKIVNNIKLFPIYKQAKNILFFYPLEDEIDLRGLLKDDKNFYLPRVNGDELEICPYKKGDKLSVSKFKTKEPLTKPVDKKIIEIVLIPAICTDYSKNRIGYGKGYYDRFLKDIEALKLIPIPQTCVIDSIPNDEFDVRADFIITEKEVII